MVPKLEFDFEDHKSEHYTVSEIVCRSLLSHKAPVLESLSLIVRDKSEALDVGIWVGIAFSRHVRELVLDLWYESCDEGGGLVKFPSVLCSCSNTLEVLKLEWSILDLPSWVCFKSLRELHLYYVEFKDDESVFNRSCGCPSLQDLVVRQSFGMAMETYTFAVPSLQRLTIVDEFQGQGEGGYVINAPSLKYLNIKGLDWIKFCLIENAPELVEAEISTVSGIENENILVSLISAKRLSLCISPLEVKYPTGNIFCHLLSLELSTNKSEWWNLLTLMLDGSPQLQILKLIGIVWWTGNRINRNVYQNVCCSILRHSCGQNTNGNEKMRKKWPHIS
ncbi:FBD-associated F-box protein At3g49020 isoform X2 [Eutrema salsugineum]|uniref:FBD-associated F-box protein At3g49020 isoform X2 n=1 Tax=Eutrema salsugineum TaxID=72664 RepID=UPI000CECF243|nr:FBD-associated F-box protein At3g49020 isoform X2 [Eutrema salsugineum]